MITDALCSVKDEAVDAVTEAQVDGVGCADKVAAAVCGGSVEA